MKKTKALQKLIEDAIQAGFDCKEDDYSVTLTKGKGDLPLGLVIWANKTANVTKVPLHLSNQLRTLKGMREELNIS